MTGQTATQMAPQDSEPAGRLCRHICKACPPAGPIMEADSPVSADFVLVALSAAPLTHPPHARATRAGRHGPGRKSGWFVQLRKDSEQTGFVGQSRPGGSAHGMCVSESYRIDAAARRSRADSDPLAPQRCQRPAVRRSVQRRVDPHRDRAYVVVSHWQTGPGPGTELGIMIDLNPGCPSPGRPATRLGGLGESAV